MNAAKKDLIDMALSTATCASFAIPYVGAFIGGGFAVAEFLFNWLDPVPPADPMSLPASTQELLAAVDAIKTHLDAAEFANKRSKMEAANDTFVLLWGGITRKIGHDTAFAWNNFATTRKTNCDAYFATTYCTGSDLDEIRLWLEPQLGSNQAVCIYALTVSLICSYRKAGLFWQNGVATDTYASQSADFKQYSNAYKLWNLTQQGPPPTTVTDPGPAPTAADLTPLNDHAIELHKNLGGMITLMQKVHDSWRTGWDSRENDIQSAHATFLAQNPGLTQMAQDVQWGQQLAYLVPSLTKKYNLDGVDEESDIGKLQDVVDHWKDIQKDLDQYF